MLCSDSVLAAARARGSGRPSEDGRTRDDSQGVWTSTQHSIPCRCAGIQQCWHRSPLTTHDRHHQETTYGSKTLDTQHEQQHPGVLCLCQFHQILTGQTHTQVHLLCTSDPFNNSGAHGHTQMDSGGAATETRILPHSTLFLRPCSHLTTTGKISRQAQDKAELRSHPGPHVHMAVAVRMWMCPDHIKGLLTSSVTVISPKLVSFWIKVILLFQIDKTLLN